MTKKEFDELIRESNERLAVCQQRLKAEFKLGSFKRFDLNQITSKLVFSDARGRAKVQADFQFVGTLSERPETWRWAWANDYLVPAMKRSSRKLRSFGERHGLARLVRDEWKADEQDAWNMTALAVNLLKAKGAYRAPFGGVRAFLLLTHVARSSVAA
jgi:hypothetical protein